METRVCAKCGKEKNINEFSKIHSQLKYRRYSCKSCETLRVKKWREDKPENFKLAQRKNNLKYTYGITLSDYDEMFEAQNGLCAICGNKEVQRQSLSIDHDHSTNKIRGLLCHKCNRALGLLQDDVSIVKKVLVYLRKNK